MCAVFTVGFTVSKQGARIPVSQDSANIVKSNVKEPRPLHEGSHRPNALRDSEVGSRERFMNSHARERYFRHAIILEANHRIAHRPQPGQAFLGLSAASPSFETKRD